MMRWPGRTSLPTPLAGVLIAGTLVGAQPVTLAAQACSPASIRNQTRPWIEYQVHVPMEEGVAPKSRHPAILARLEPIAALFREAYPEPRGTEADGRARIGSYGTEIPDGPFQFGYSINIAALACPTGRSREGTVPDVRGWAVVYLNTLYRMLAEVGELPIDGQPAMVWQLAQRTGSFKGETLYEVKAGLEYGKAVVLSRPGRLPWKTISEKQYLDALEVYLRRQGGEADSTMQEFERLFTAQIAEARKTLTGETRDKVVAEMERALAEARAQRPARVGNVDHAVAEILDAIATYRAAHSARELARPAVMPQGTARTFVGEFGKESEGGHQLVVVDPTYFKKGAPVESIQFATLIWGADVEVPALGAWHEAFERRFAIDRLRAMVDP